MPDTLGPEAMVQALDLLGADLRAAGELEQLLVHGGGCLQLMGLISRETLGLDLVARKEGEHFVPLAQVPEAVARSLARVRRLVPLPPGLLDVTGAAAMPHGLPPGFEGRLGRREFGGLVLFLPDRRDLVFLKLNAAVDRGDPAGKHVADLAALSPTPDELVAGGRWALTHTDAPEFRTFLCQVLRALGVTDPDRKLPAGR